MNDPEAPYLSCVRRLKLDAGHRVHLHESKCRNAHGHQYIVYIHATADQLDSIGRIIDFSVLKELIGGWLDEFWDHGFLVWDQDTEMIKALGMIDGQKTYKLPYNPTAENMACFLLTEICPAVLKTTGVTVTKVEVWETENCYGVAEF